jgi:hypothetical protein
MTFAAAMQRDPDACLPPPLELFDRIENEKSPKLFHVGPFSKYGSGDRI